MDFINFLIDRLSWQDLAIAAGILMLFLLFRKIFTTYVFKLILSLSRKVPTDVVTNILLAFERPVRSFFVFVGINASFLYLPFPTSYDVAMHDIMRTLIIVHIAWGFYNLSSTSSTIFVRVGKKLNIELDQILLPFVSKFVRFAILAMALSIIADEWGYNVNGFVAGLGLGGLAFALAAQDSISNFFGGVIIITEKPFTMGDWIKTPSVEGFVEGISFRSTKIRTFSDSLVTVPNSTLANEAIENWTKMDKRLVSSTLGVTYSTPKEKLEICVKRINDLLHSREDVDKDIILVNFDKFNQSSMDIFIYYFTKSTKWKVYMEIKEDINLQIINILAEEGVSIAFPSRSIYMEGEKEKKRDDHINL